MRSVCALCGETGYHYCTKLEGFYYSYDVNSAYKRVSDRSVSGKVGGIIAGGLMGGPIGAIAGLFLGDTLDD